MSLYKFKSWTLTKEQLRRMESGRNVLLQMGRMIQNDGS